MKKITIVVGYVAMLAAMVANLATLPVLVPGYLAEGATAPTDVNEVVAASEQLKRTGLALLLTAFIVERAPAPAVPVNFCAGAAIALAVYRARDVVAIIIVWAGHIRGERAMDYWVCVTLLVASVVPTLYRIVT